MRILFLLLLPLLSWPAFSQAKPSDVTRFTLDNGLKVIVKEDHRAPVAVSMIWYNVGSKDETIGKTGIAHALEHLMFKGTKQYPQGVFSKTISGLGGQENAFTNNDYTAYFEKIAVQHLPTIFKLEADRMQNLVLDKKEFASEIKVIQEERRLRTDDNPQALTFERFLAAAHLASPYHHPVIGWMNDLEQLTIDDIKAWYHSFYAPNNATLVVVGDVNANQVFKLAQTYFGKLKPKPSVSRKNPVEPPLLGKKTVTVNVPAQVPMLMLGYTVPSVATTVKQKAADPYALEVIAAILDAGDSGRLTKELVRGKQVASRIETYYNLYSRYQTQFILYATPSQASTLEDLKKSILAELRQLKDTQVSPQELQRAKTQIIAQKTFERDSIFSQAMELGLLETIGLGTQAAEEYIDKINRVTPEEVQSVARRYFNENALTEAVLIPAQPQRGQQ